MLATRFFLKLSQHNHTGLIVMPIINLLDNVINKVIHIVNYMA